MLESKKKKEKKEKKKGRKLEKTYHKMKGKAQVHKAAADKTNCNELGQALLTLPGFPLPYVLDLQQRCYIP